MVIFIGRVVSVLLLAATLYGAYVATDRFARASLERSTTDQAITWLGYFSTNIDAFADLVQTGQPSADQLAQLDRAQSLFHVFRFQLFDADGRVSFVSDTLGEIPGGPYALPPPGSAPQQTGQISPGAVAAIRSNAAHVVLNDGHDRADRPQTYAEVYLPVHSGAAIVGAVEVYVDATAALASNQRVFAGYAGVIAALFVFALAIPSTHLVLAGQGLKRNKTEIEAARDALADSAERDRDMADKQMRLAREIMLLGELNQWLQSSRSQDEMFEMVIGFLEQLIPQCEGSVYVYSNSRDVLDGCAEWNGARVKPHIHPEDCWALRRGRTYEFGQSEVAFACAHVDGDDNQPYFCFPMLAHGETVGLLHLRQREGVSNEAFQSCRKLAQLCAEQISMAIANVRMRDELQNQSIRDPLTGLFNRRQLTEMLRKLLSAAARSDRPVALLSLDVDHFKKFNDNFGHDAGDMVLRAVGGVLDKHTSGDELACRPGGEEFMVVLPDCETPDALIRAEEIREDIQAIRIRYGQKELPGITVSIGVAISTYDGKMPQDLMRSADEALYAAKARGRNQSMLTSLINAPENAETIGDAEAPQSASQDIAAE